MTKLIKGLAFTLALVSLNPLFAETIKKSFKDVSEVKIRTTSAKCIIEKSGSKEITVEVNFTYDKEDYEVEMDKRGSRLYLNEEFLSRRHHGHATWRIIMPKGIEVNYSTASGDLEASDLGETEITAKTASGDVKLENFSGSANVSTASGEVSLTTFKGELEVSTASGDISLKNVNGQLEIGAASGRIEAFNINGDFEFGTASGDIRVDGAKGSFELGAASGDITANDVTLEGKCRFNAASGDVEVELAASPEDDVEVSAASGDATLDYSGHNITGFIEMTANVDRGRIQAPFKFDSEKHFSRGRNEYVTKMVKKGNGPSISISSASGTAELKE